MCSSDLVNGDGFADLITGAVPGNPHVKVFDGKKLLATHVIPSGDDPSLLAQGFAYGLNFNVGANVADMQLEAFKYYYTPGKDVGVAGIVIRPTPALVTMQQELIAAVAPFTVETGPIGAFTAPHDDPTYDALLIGYVSTFVPKQTGEQFSPHVSTGVAPLDYLDKMLAEPFTPFTFSPVGASVYQLGPFGTAAKKLVEWDLQRQDPDLMSGSDEMG